ncbi:MAG TPA: hypothetical protein VGV35_13975 [Bryobacteraceae bacterium]|nr:hypothetical protein [Bryobacteraceae bacterium]
MSSYLEAYGADEEQRAKRIHQIKIASIVVVCALVVGAALFGIFRNYSEEQQAKAFVASLRAQDYSAAYRMWGCTDAHPCTEYPLAKFMDDWGPKSPHADQSSTHIGVSQSCGSGVVIRLDYKGTQPVPLWVERDTKTISFAPWPECPGKHLHIGAWLRSLFN